jgi:3-oxoacyl-[acyl-carrier protein] reductase
VTVAVVTGASRGIGRATTRVLLERGVKVVTLTRASAKFDDAKREFASSGETHLALACDVAKSDEVSRAAETALATFGPPDLVINNAGLVARGHTIESTPESVWDDVIDVNLKGPFLVTRAFLPSMRANARGRFLFVGSISSTIGCAGVASYAAAKWGLVGFVKSLAEELRGTPLIAAALLPGSVDTDMLIGSGFEPKMSADDVARMLVHLGLDAPSAIHGSAIEMFGS